MTKEGNNLPSNKTILSGIQPSGALHIGNYLGAIKQWVDLQQDNQAYYCIVDLHAITVPYQPEELKKNILDTAAIYLAAGLDPAASTIFVQSHIPAHTELAWLLSTQTPLGELQRMTQFKEKKSKMKHSMTESFINKVVKHLHESEDAKKLLSSGKEEELKELLTATLEENEVIEQLNLLTDSIVTLGLFSYPILMAADILLYQADTVPVGEDQIQHIELARDIAKRFNNKLGESFTVPKPYLNKNTARIMSLTNPTIKMSKSDAAKSYIGITDEPEVIRKKIMKATTETEANIMLSTPSINNLLNLYVAASEEDKSAIVNRYKGKGFKEFKEDLAEEVIKMLAPLQERYRELRADENQLNQILADGRDRAAATANQTLSVTKQKMGLT